MPLGQLSASFQSLPPLPTNKLVPSGADSLMGGFVYILGPRGSLQRTLLGGWEFLLLLLQPPQVFTASSFEALFPRTGTLGCSVCLAPQLFLMVYLHKNVGPRTPSTATLPTPVLQPPRCRESSLPGSLPPTGLDEYFFFTTLVVGLPHSSIFWQFWLFYLFLNLLLSFFWLSREAQCICLCLHLGRKWNPVFLCVKPARDVSFSLICSPICLEEGFLNSVSGQVTKVSKLRM